MAQEFKLPEVSEGVESADIAEITVSEGDVIEAGQVVFEVETEKAVAEIECPYAGKISKIHVSEGDSVQVGQALLTVEETEAAAEKSESAPQAPEETQTEAEPEQAGKPETSAEAAAPETEQPTAQATETPPPRATAPPQPQPAVAPGEEGNGEPPPPAGPATRRLARELGVDLHNVSGSGRGGRITQEDVQAYVRSLTQGGAAAGGAAAAPPALPDFSKFGPTERQALSKIARTSAANLSTSWSVIPHVTQHDVCDITDLEAARKRYMQGAGQSGPKITMTAVAIKASVAALKEFPQFNASLDPQTNELVLKRYYHIGVAVDTEHGLLVPVIRDADRKSIVDVAAELTDIAERARSRKLAMDEMQGATFTITNLGGIGGTAFTPIVNYPEVAILGMSRYHKELRLVDGEPVERLMLPLSLSYDHRVINGADAARFVVRLTRSLSDCFHLLVQV